MQAVYNQLRQINPHAHQVFARSEKEVFENVSRGRACVFTMCLLFVSTLCTPLKAASEAHRSIRWACIEETAARSRTQFVDHFLRKLGSPWCTVSLRERLHRLVEVVRMRGPRFFLTHMYLCIRICIWK